MIIDDLIYDRTQSDVERLKALRAIGYDNMTASEKTEYANSKGAYNYTDLNRIGQAMTYIKNLMDQIPIDLEDYFDLAVAAVLDSLDYDQSYYTPDDPILPISLKQIPYTTPVAIEAVKTDWANGMFAGLVTDAPNNTYSVLYILNNLNILRALLPLTGAPATPASFDNLTYTSANAIERILKVIYDTAIQYQADKEAAIDAAEAEASAKYDNIQYNWIWSGEAYAGEF